MNHFFTQVYIWISISQLLQSKIMIRKQDLASVIPTKLKSSILYILYKF